MTKATFDKIRAGLGEARAYLDGSGNKRDYRIHVPARVNVKKIRTQLGLSQESFAQTYGFALSAVRDWEQGRRQPERSARILLRGVEEEPEAVIRAWAKTARTAFGVLGERLRRAARFPEEADASRIRAELRADRGD